jgi:hypothetical protein
VCVGLAVGARAAPPAPGSLPARPGVPPWVAHLTVRHRRAVGVLARGAVRAALRARRLGLKRARLARRARRLTRCGLDAAGRARYAVAGQGGSCRLHIPPGRAVLARGLGTSPGSV